MKKVVYFLGAGFSAPAGIPVISDFLFRARDQYAKNAKRFSEFEAVFEYIDSLAVAKNFVVLDLFNIEEIFSIADVHQLIRKGVRSDLEKFIKDVVQFHTPSFQYAVEPYQQGKHSKEWLYGGNSVEPYVTFVCALAGLKFEILQSVKHAAENGTELSSYDIGVSDDRQADYRIISLNYDELLEKSCDFINQGVSGEFSLDIAKLHGSVGSTIVPPSWHKSIADNDQITTAWKNAAEWIKEANEIRIIGYSLPITDVYIKYLFSTSLSEASNIQKIEAIGLDPTGQVETRFRRMFDFPKFKFVNTNTESYLSCLRSTSGESVSGWAYNYTERNHEAYMKRF